ncbi:MAG: hypothetical protein CM1200mP1_16600 [Candidatus Neomarinimicrobiota bacterium]|nr:MAG: hypothetical protein CM1200mP1_16600 [Candidatus Neomarinimicrobiota bacterium]
MPWIILGVVTFIILLKIPAPYGKFSNTSWGPMIPSKLGWFVMEIISPVAFAYFFFTGLEEKSWITWVFLSVGWVIILIEALFILCDKKIQQKCPFLLPFCIVV